MKIHLKKAISFKGNELQTLDLDLDTLTGEDLIKAESEVLQSGGTPLQTLSFSRPYAITVAAKALRMPVEILRQMGARDFSKIVNEVQTFLAASDSEEPPQETENPPQELSAV